MACSNLSQLRMLAGDMDEAIGWGNRAIAFATELSEQAILVHARINVGSALLGIGDDAGWPILEECAATARQLGFEDDAARAMTNLAWNAWSQYQLERAEGHLDEGIAYAGERDLVAMELYQRGIRASVWLARGAWDDAACEADAVRLLPTATLPTRIVAQTCFGRIKALRGEDAGQPLDEARELALQIGELQRVGHVAAARAEAAWLQGDPERVIQEARETFEAAVARQDRWIAGHLGLWLHRAGEHVPAERLAEPYALEIRGDAAAAAAWWRERGYPLEAARAQASSGDECDLRVAFDTFEAMDARADAALTANLLREMGARRVPRGPRPATRANIAHLTQRELEVLQLLDEGGSNREIADRLYLSPKTVGHHVSSILSKLQVSSRGDAVQHAHTLGLLQGRDTPAPK